MIKGMAVSADCIERRPTTQSVYLMGRAVNLSAISRSQGIDPSHLSRIFSGRRNPSIKYARKIASALGLRLDEFLDALDGTKKKRKERSNAA